MAVDTSIGPLDIRSEEHARRVFSAIAADYDRFNTLSSLGMHRLWRRAAVREAGLKRTSQVLDLAAGTGDLTLALAERGRPARILATDVVPEMLDLARAKASRYAGPTRIEFDLMDAQALPLPDESFDVVTVAFGVRNMPDRTAAFREARRVLRPGGRYVVLEFSRPPLAPVRSVYHAYLREVIPKVGRIVAKDRAPFEHLVDTIHAFPGQVAIAGELHRAGFSRVTWRNLSAGIVAVHVAIK